MITPCGILISKPPPMNALSQNSTISTEDLQRAAGRSHFLPTARTQKSFIRHHVSRASERMRLKEKHVPEVERFAIALRSHHQAMDMFQEMFQQAKDSVVRLLSYSKLTFLTAI